MTEANLDGANFKGANLEEAFYEEEIFNGMVYKLICPGFDPSEYKEGEIEIISVGNEKYYRLH